MRLLLLCLASLSHAYLQLTISTSATSRSGINGLWLSTHPSHPSSPHLIAVTPLDPARGATEEEYTAASWDVLPGTAIDSWTIFNLADSLAIPRKYYDKGDIAKRLLYLGYEKKKGNGDNGNSGEVGLFRPKEGRKDWRKIWGKWGDMDFLTIKNYDTLFSRSQNTTRTAYGAEMCELPILRPAGQLYACIPSPLAFDASSTPITLTLSPPNYRPGNCEPISLNLRIPYPQFTSFSSLRSAASEQRMREKTAAVKFRELRRIVKVQRNKEALGKQQEQEAISNNEGKGNGRSKLNAVAEEEKEDEEGFGRSETDWEEGHNESKVDVEVPELRRPFEFHG